MCTRDNLTKLTVSTDVQWSVSKIYLKTQRTSSWHEIVLGTTFSFIQKPDRIVNEPSTALQEINHDLSGKSLSVLPALVFRFRYWDHLFSKLIYCIVLHMKIFIFPLTFFFFARWCCSTTQKYKLIEFADTTTRGETQSPRWSAGWCFTAQNGAFSFHSIALVGKGTNGDFTTQLWVIYLRKLMLRINYKKWENNQMKV